MMPLHALTDASEIDLRLDKVRKIMRDMSVDALLLSDNANVFYTLGRVIAGYVYLDVDGNCIYFIRRPEGLTGHDVEYIRKPEQIPGLLEKRGIKVPVNVGLELSIISYADVMRIKALFPDAAIVDCTPVMRMARSVKTDAELQLLRRSGIKHDMVYRLIPQLYRIGMSDVELQIEIERRSRLEGCLGQFRISGQSMELFMGNVLAGENADMPTPYDFAMGGKGVDPSLPVGADGTVIAPGMSVMVDTNGNFTGYMTDMTRVFSLGELTELALKAHQCSIEICHRMCREAIPGTKASDLYAMAVDMVERRGLSDYFMGHRQKAGFIGHGVGIEINELPVIAPRSRDILAENNVVAFEPKFVIPKVGAVGIENTYIVRPGGLECITGSPEEIIAL